MALTIDEAHAFIGSILSLYPQQNTQFTNNDNFISALVETHIERMNQLGLEALQQRFTLVRNLNYTEAARKEIKFFADALKYSLSDQSSLASLRKRYITQGSDLDTLPAPSDALLEIQRFKSNSDSNSEAALEGRESLQSLLSDLKLKP
jgi:hypothetical protein